ncbi:hypothetical protein WCT80_09640 [Pectobacterium carotovorum]|uniref:hypothetical protein n=1 Tax=Pectobacterium carotovorum TaxID=554 RepID=UPI003016CDD7
MTNKLISELNCAAGNVRDYIFDLERKVAALEQQLAVERLPQKLRDIGNNIRTQDDRITSDPLFCVFQKKEMVTDEDYDHDRVVWWHSDGFEASEVKAKRLELLHRDLRDTGEWRRLAVKIIDVFVTSCFTEKGCKDYLSANGHNLNSPFIYVMSGYRNNEYQAVRNFLSGIPAEGE